MKLTFLGTGNAFAPQRDWPGILVDDCILLDAGPSVLVNLKRLAIDPARLRHIFITHFHGDHFFGLPFLLLDIKYLSPSDIPLSIIGPPGIEERVCEVLDLAYPGTFHELPRPVQFIEGDPGVRMTIDGIAFTPERMAHGGETLCAYGYRIDLPDGTLAYTGDTTMTDNVFSLIDGAQVVILEATSEEESPAHLGVQALRSIIDRTPKNSAVFLTHFDTPDAKAWADLNATLPQDRESFLIETTPGCAPIVRKL